MKIEEIILEQDIHTFYVQAESFPDGISKAFEHLHALLPSVTNRNFFGLSRPDKNGVITYMAAVQETIENEGAVHGCRNVMIRKGRYTSVLLRDYEKDPQSIRRAFEELLKDAELDPQGYCVEMYLGAKDLRCLVRLKN